MAVMSVPSMLLREAQATEEKLDMLTKMLIMERAMLHQNPPPYSADPPVTHLLDAHALRSGRPTVNSSTASPNDEPETTRKDRSERKRQLKLEKRRQKAPPPAAMETQRLPSALLPTNPPQSRRSSFTAFITGRSRSISRGRAPSDNDERRVSTTSLLTLIGRGRSSSRHRLSAIDRTEQSPGPQEALAVALDEPELTNARAPRLPSFLWSPRHGSSDAACSSPYFASVFDENTLYSRDTSATRSVEEHLQEHSVHSKQTRRQSTSTLLSARSDTGQGQGLNIIPRQKRKPVPAQTARLSMSSPNLMMSSTRSNTPGERTSDEVAAEVIALLDLQMRRAQTTTDLTATVPVRSSSKQSRTNYVHKHRQSQQIEFLSNFEEQQMIQNPVSRQKLPAPLDHSCATKTAVTTRSQYGPPSLTLSPPNNNGLSSSPSSDQTASSQLRHVGNPVSRSKNVHTVVTQQAEKLRKRLRSRSVSGNSRQPLPEEVNLINLKQDSTSLMTTSKRSASQDRLGNLHLVGGLLPAVNSPEVRPGPEPLSSHANATASTTIRVVTDTEIFSQSDRQISRVSDSPILRIIEPNPTMQIIPAAKDHKSHSRNSSTDSVERAAEYAKLIEHLIPPPTPVPTPMASAIATVSSGISPNPPTQPLRRKESRPFVKPLPAPIRTTNLTTSANATPSPSPSLSIFPKVLPMPKIPPLALPRRTVTDPSRLSSAPASATSSRHNSSPSRRSPLFSHPPVHLHPHPHGQADTPTSAPLQAKSHANVTVKVSHPSAPARSPLRPRGGSSSASSTTSVPRNFVVCCGCKAWLERPGRKNNAKVSVKCPWCTHAVGPKPDGGCCRIVRAEVCVLA